jgi:hypothetical protein
MSLDSTKPVPDPTALTTEQILREVYHLRELIEARLGQMDASSDAAQVANQKAVEAALTTSSKAVEAAQAANQKAIDAALLTSNKAVEAALAASDKAILELDSSISRRVASVVELTDSKFITYRTLLDSQSEKVALALSASDKAVAKAEQYNNAQFLSITEKIDDLKEYRNITSGQSAGQNLDTRLTGQAAQLASLADYRSDSLGRRKGGTELWGLIGGGIALIISLILIGLRLAGL